MTRAAGRRIAEVVRPERGGRLPGLLLAFLVAVTAGALAYAGQATQPTGVRGPAEASVTPEARQLSCPSSDPDGGVTVGLLPGTQGGRVTADGRDVDLPSAGTARIDPTADSVTVTATGSATRGLFATKGVPGGGMTACGFPRASWWFVGGGGSPGHPSVVELSNPRSGPAVVDLRVYDSGGAVAGPGLRGISVRSGATRRIELANVAPSAGVLAVHVEASRGLVVAQLDDATRDVRDPTAKPVRQWLPAEGAAQKRLVLGGLPADRDDTTVVLANPGSSEAVARVRLSTADGAFAPKGVEPVTVPPDSVVTVPVVLDDPHTEVVVDADQPLLGGASVLGAKDLVHAVSARPWDGPAATALPEGGDRTLTLTAEDGAAAVTVSTYGPEGKQLDRERVQVPDLTSVSRDLDPDAASVVVTSAGGVVGVVQVRRDGRTSALPLTPVLAALRVPVVRPAG